MSKNDRSITIVIDTSNNLFSETTDKIVIGFENFTLKYAINPYGNLIKAGSQNKYVLKDSRLTKDVIQKFKIEKENKFIGTVMGEDFIPVSLGYYQSNDWRLKRVRIYYENETKPVVDTNPRDEESKSVWLTRQDNIYYYPNKNTKTMISSAPEVKIVIDTSSSSFSGTNDEIKITFTKELCSNKKFIGENISTYILNPGGKELKTGSTNTYIFKDAKLIDKSYVKKFRIEKKFGFFGKIFGGGPAGNIPVGFRYSDDWKIKRIRIYYNGELVSDTNPSNSESKSFLLDKTNYWFAYPDPNTEVIGPEGVCGNTQSLNLPVQASVPFYNTNQSYYGFNPEGVL